MLQLNRQPFIIHIIHIVCHVHSPLQPSYICEGKGQSSGIAESASKAMTSVYQSVFGTKTKYARLSYLGLEQPKTAQKLLEGIIFRPFIIETYLYLLVILVKFNQIQIELVVIIQHLYFTNTKENNLFFFNV